MKKLLLICLISVAILNAKESISLNTNNQDLKRVFPAQQEHILSYSNILQKVKTSIVNISTQKSVKNSSAMPPIMNDPFFRQFFRGYPNMPKERIQRSLGSGVIISNDGYIVTNNHVVDGAQKIKVSIKGDKKEYEAKLIGKDPKSDIAIIKIDAKNLNAITIYDSDKVKVGDVVFAIGNPFGVGETITHGIVSATGRSSVGIVEYENFIQTDAPINPGNSGGALINSAGYLIGMNSAIISRSGSSAGIGFAIPSNMIKSVAKALINDGKYTRAYLGVGISNVSEEMSSFYNHNYGALITSVEDNTPAKKGGLKRGDLIIEVNGKKVKTASQLKNLIGSYKPDTTISIKILRDKKLYTKTIKLDSQDKLSLIKGSKSYKGLSVENQKTNTNGVLVSKVDPKSKAAEVGIVKGDIIIQIEDHEINNTDDFKKAIKNQNKKRIYLNRRGIIFAVVL